jgi:ribonucleotide reductase beta subunit family protein with ferritin-like domain
MSTTEALLQPEEERDLEERARPFRALYEHWEANQWSPLELDLSQDRASFQALGDGDRQGMMWIFAHRFHAEFTVATILAPFVMRAPSYELQVCLSTQLADEFRHMQSVLRVYDEVFGIRSHNRVRAIADSNIDPVAEALYEALHGYVAPLERSVDEDLFLQAVVAYHLIAEGVVARTAQNLAGDQYARFGTFPGLTRGQRLVARDEARHIGIGVSYARQRMAESREHATAVIGSVVEHFGELSTRLLETALAGDMDAQVLSGYGVEAEGFYAEAMRLWQIRLRSIGYLEDR